MTDWTFADDYMRQGARAAARTDDPRVVALLVSDPDPFPPDGDVFAPAFARTEQIGGYDSPDAEAIARAYDDAIYRLGEEVARRYLRVFYGVEVIEVWSRVHRGDGVRIFDTPHWREHVGIGDEPRPWRVTSATGPGQGFRETRHDGTLTEAEARWAHLAEAGDGDTRRVTSCGRVSVLAGDVEEWQAYLDGEVYAVGALVNPDHVLWADDEGTPTDEGDGWELDTEGLVYGHYGDAYAREAALQAAQYAAQELPALLPWGADA